MDIFHGDYLKFEVPDKWTVEEDTDSTSIYDINGKGALTMSFYSVMNINIPFDEHICIMAKKFFDDNNINLNQSFILDTTKEDKLILYATGISADNWYIKFWIVAKFPKIVILTYQSENKTSEVKKIDKIVESFSFLF